MYHKVVCLLVALAAVRIGCPIGDTLRSSLLRGNCPNWLSVGDSAGCGEFSFRWMTIALRGMALRIPNYLGLIFDRYQVCNF